MTVGYSFTSYIYIYIQPLPPPQNYENSHTEKWSIIKWNFLIWCLVYHYGFIILFEIVVNLLCTVYTRHIIFCKCSLDLFPEYLSLVWELCHPFNPPGVPSISELTFSATTRTLTCISTGGPATNVTWRMGGSELTVDGSMYQFMQILTDGTTSTYTNVLTIVSSDLTPIIGSNFTCEVENSRGRAAMNITIPCKNNIYTYMC